jgi:hypothetical protein
LPLDNTSLKKLSVTSKLSVNIMPKVIYEKIYGDALLYTTMCL